MTAVLWVRPLMLAAATFAISIWLTGRVLRFAQRQAILDHPSERSSHSRPTPRGGGLAIVVAFLLGLGAGTALEIVPLRLAVALGGGGALIALVGWRDDRVGVPPRVRLLWQAVAASWALGWLGGYPSMALGGFSLPLGVLGVPVAIAGIVWAINLFNFMDGIDGIAGIEALSIGLGGALLLLVGGLPDGAAVSLMLAAAALGFLKWNWAPARIFMGDVGSGFLGLVVAVLAVWSERNSGPPAVLWSVLGMVFVFDATLTLVRRAFRGERVTEAHRSHAYQRLVMAGWSHAGVSLATLAINLVLVCLCFLPPLTALGIAVLLLGVVYFGVERVRRM